MNIIVFTYKAQISGGSNRSLLSILEILTQRGHNVTLFLPGKDGEMYQEAKKIGVKCIYKKFNPIIEEKKHGLALIEQTVRLYYRLVREYYRANKYAKDIARLSPDIIYSNGVTIHAGRIIAKLLKLPHVWHIREISFSNESFLRPIGFYKIMASGTTKFILISNDLYNIFKNHVTEDKLIMISNGIKYSEQPPLIPHEEFNILLTARICKDKRQEDAIEALNLIYKERPHVNIHLYFAGSTVSALDVTYKHKLEDLIQSYDLNPKVRFLGEIKNLPTIRQKMDIELLCSSREPFGRVTVEGMRSGLCIVASNSGGTKDIIIDGTNGFLFEPHNVLDIKDKILNLYDKPELRKNIGLNAKEFSKTHFTEAQLYKTVQLLEELTNVQNK